MLEEAGRAVAQRPAVVAVPVVTGEDPAGHLPDLLGGPESAGGGPAGEPLEGPARASHGPLAPCALIGRLFVGVDDEEAHPGLGAATSWTRVFGGSPPWSRAGMPTGHSVHGRSLG